MLFSQVLGRAFSRAEAKAIESKQKKEEDGERGKGMGDAALLLVHAGGLELLANSPRSLSSLSPLPLVRVFTRKGVHSS